VNTISSTNGGIFDSISELGIRVADTGKISLDKDVLTEKMRSHPDDIRALLYGATATDTGIFHAIHTIAGGLSDAASGSVQNAITGYESSVKSMNNSIASKQEAIARLRESLIRQFAAVDAAIGQLNSQGTALTSIMTSLNNSNNNS
jgi:flagellar hook-associated protein 2